MTPTPAIHIIIYVAAALSALFCLGIELRRCLMMFQQNSYRRERYLKWLKQSGDSTSGRRLCGMIIFFIALTPFSPNIVSAVLIAIFSIISGFSMARRRYKKPLVMTMRASRIYITALLLAAVVAAIAMTLTNVASQDRKSVV